MINPLKSPGVYLVEENAFPGSIVAVQTAIPAFIGYTEKAISNGQSLQNRATRINSMADFTNFFGGMPPVRFTLTQDRLTPPAISSIYLNGVPFSVETASGSLFYLYNTIRLFYLNGGGSCYIISVGDYSAAPDNNTLVAAVDVLTDVQDVTMILIPDGLLLTPAEYYNNLVPKMLAHCGQTQNRIAILEVFNGNTVNAADLDKPVNVISDFRDGIGNTSLEYGVAYFPWLNALVIQNDEINFTCFGDLSAYFEPAVAASAKTILAAYTNADPASPGIDLVIKQVNDALLSLSENYTTIINAAVDCLNVLPPGPAIAGVYTVVDQSQGVWTAPANVSLTAVSSPTVSLHDTEQQGLSIDAIGGKSINVIRFFAGIGALVWGAHTLDGNSQDWRYINVKRTMIMIEQSIRLGTQSYVFEPNDPNTWASVKSMIGNFLHDLWQKGALQGATPEAAYNVMAGLGSTMTGEDILAGIMNVTVMVAITHPAEFIVISFSQQQQTS
jgi:phage tail sheath protein FI